MLCSFSPLSAQWNWNPDENNSVSAGAPVNWWSIFPHPLYMVPMINGMAFFWGKDTSRDDTFLYGQKLSINGQIVWRSEDEQYALLSQDFLASSGFTATAFDSVSATLAWLETNPWVSSLLKMQRIDTSGSPQWTAPTLVDTLLASSMSNELQLVPLGNGTTWFVYSHSRIRPQLRSVDRYGGLIQSQPLSLDSNTTMVYFHATPNTNCGITVAYSKSDTVLPWPILGIRVQSFDGSGTPLWKQGGLELSNSPNSGQWVQSVLLADSSVLVVWVESNTTGPDSVRFLAQRLSTSGQLMFDSLGLEVAVHPSGSGNDAKLVAAPDTSAILVKDLKKSMFAQKITRSGMLAWSPNGITLSDTTVYGLTIDAVVTSQGDLIVTWLDDRDYSSPGVDVYAQRVNPAGVVQWSPRGVAMSTHPDWKSHPVVEMLGDTPVFGWVDFRPDSMGVYASMLRLDGTHMPLELLTFLGTALPEGNRLSWTARGEEDLLSYNVQRRSATHQNVWQFLGERIPHGAPGVHDHEFIDAEPPDGVAEYRLACLQFDGSTRYSPVIEIQRASNVAPLTMTLYPNPVHDQITIELRSSTSIGATIVITDLLGREVRRFDNVSGNRVLTWDLTNTQGRRVSPGLYSLSLVSDAALMTKLLIVK